MTPSRRVLGLGIVPLSLLPTSHGHTQTPSAGQRQSGAGVESVLNVALEEPKSPGKGGTPACNRRGHNLPKRMDLLVSVTAAFPPNPATMEQYLRSLGEKTFDHPADAAGLADDRTE